MNLVGQWEAEPYLYQVWEIDGEYFCVCTDTRASETLCVGYGQTPYEAVWDGVRGALGAGAKPS